MAVSDVAERLEERLAPARERVARRIEPAFDRLVEVAPDRLAERLEPAARRLERAAGRRRGPVATVSKLAGRATEGTRAATQRVSEYVGERLGSDSTWTWGTRVGFLSAGFLLGFLLGWWARTGRQSEAPPESESLGDGFAQAPRLGPTISETESAGSR